MPSFTILIIILHFLLQSLYLPLPFKLTMYSSFTRSHYLCVPSFNTTPFSPFLTSDILSPILLLLHLLSLYISVPYSSSVPSLLPFPSSSSPGINKAQRTSAKFSQRTNLVIMPCVFAHMIVGMLSEYEQNLPLYSIFTILNSVTGVLVLFLHCFNNQQVRSRRRRRR